MIELLVTMGLVIVVLAITGAAFNAILKTTGRLISSEESNIEGIVGLEMFRHDIQQAGYGLPHTFSATGNAPKYAEATVEPASWMNDGKGTANAPAFGDVPRSIASWNDVAATADSTSEAVTYNILGGTDYLAIKASSVGTNTAARKWTYLTYSSGGKSANTWANADENLDTNPADRVIVLNRTFSSAGVVTNNLVYVPDDPNNTYWVNYTNGSFNSAYSPTNSQQIYYLYGITHTATDLVMPFNRADFFVARPADEQKIPSSCAPGTGILYKTNVNHGTTSGTKTGKLTYMPLLDCVADMQVVFGWDMTGTGVIEESSAYHSDATKISVSGSLTKDAIKAIMESPSEIRGKLKYVKVYIMAQDGRKDSGFTNSAAIRVGDATNSGLTKTYTVANLTTNQWLNYRWKIYRIVVYPKNLALN